MNKIKTFFLAFVSSLSMTANAGGILTNTNQNIAFLRNPARDGAIGIDGVYYKLYGFMSSTGGLRAIWIDEK